MPTPGKPWQNIRNFRRWMPGIRKTPSRLLPLPRLKRRNRSPGKNTEFGEAVNGELNRDGGQKKAHQSFDNLHRDRADESSRAFCGQAKDDVASGADDQNACD